MPEKSRIVSPGRDGRSVVTEEGRTLIPPDGWVLLPPGDAALTRSVKKAGPSWQVQSRKGRRTFSQGVWALAETVTAAKKALADKRATPEYAKRRKSDLLRREKKQVQYAGDFYENVLVFLDFHLDFSELAERVARAVADLATPVGSGTVARTERIPIEERARAAVIAWMRHQTTAYDHMSIARVKGRRREVRRELARKSNQLLERYRAGDSVDPAACPLRQALERANQ